MKNQDKKSSAVAVALDGVLKRAQEREQVDGEVAIDLHNAKFIIFSDHHKGNRNGADDFRLCERAYNAALAYYDRLGYTLVVLGDVEELWEERPKAVLQTYAHTVELEGNFHKEGRYYRFYGNHDDAWSHPDLVEKLLAPALGGEAVRVKEAIILHVRDGEDEIGRLFLTHGHQGTLDSDVIAPFSKLVVRYIWRPIQRLVKVSFNTPAKMFKLRKAHDSNMYLWSEAQEKLVLIVGHTHRPVFKSESHDVVIRKALIKVEETLAQDPSNVELRQLAASLAAELEWVLSQNQQSPDGPAAVQLEKPSYFNTGCCAFSDGDVTGLEISGGEIRLVRWPDDEKSPKAKVLASAKLKDVFEKC